MPRDEAAGSSIQGSSPSLRYVYIRLPRTNSRFEGMTPVSGGSRRRREGGTVHGSASSSSGGSRTPRIRPRRRRLVPRPRPALVQSVARSQGTPIDRAMERSRRRETRCCLDHVRAAGAARRSVAEATLGSASWLGKRRSDESSPMSGRPSIASVNKWEPRVVPAPPAAHCQRTATHGRLFRNAIARAPRALPGGGRHPEREVSAAIRTCRSRLRGRSRSRRAARGTHQRRRAVLRDHVQTGASG